MNENDIELIKLLKKTTDRWYEISDAKIILHFKYGKIIGKLYCKNDIEPGDLEPEIRELFDIKTK